MADQEIFARAQHLGESIVASVTCRSFETNFADARDIDAHGREFNLQRLRLTGAVLAPERRVCMQSMIDMNGAHAIAVRLGREASERMQQHRGIKPAAEGNANGCVRRQQYPAPGSTLHTILQLTWREHEPRHRQLTL